MPRQPMTRLAALLSNKTVFMTLMFFATVQSALSVILRYSQSTPSLFAALTYSAAPGEQSNHGSRTSPPYASPTASACGASNTTVDLNWYPPVHWEINNLQHVFNDTGLYGWIFNSSQGSLNTYNWCNMPHTHPATYPKVADSSYTLEYVEVIHRHHKRTPYAANTFPVESYPWYCDDEGLAFGGKPINPSGNQSAATYWSVYTSSSNPLIPKGFNGTCRFPQITRGGLDDSHQHGVDLKAVYSDLLGFIPKQYNANVVSYRVTNNVITSQVVAMLIAGMYPERTNQDQPLLIQPDSIDSLEPAYSCPSASSLFNSYGPGSSSTAWGAHITYSTPMKLRLDAISGVDSDASDWSRSWDHYFDNLSSRLCHDKPLPCNIDNPNNCITMADAEQVFRLGEYEYSFIYRDSRESFPASISSYGIWVAELAQNLRHAMSDGPSSVNARPDRVKYRHNVAHDGSLARLLAILQIDRMVWPGMGAEVVFELYSKAGCYYLRVLWGGQIMKSSNPSFGGAFDMVPVEVFLAYLDALVGVGASKVPALCRDV